ncbi:MAG: purine-nucleoside phosphorylase [Pirellulaceae bacterium]
MTAVEMARAHISRQWPVQPRAAVILGTGLGRLVEHVQPDVMIPFADLPGFPRTTALGHHGRVVCGRLNGIPLILLDGRCHLYEGYSLDQVTLPVRVLHACGAQLLIVSNASGGLNPEFASGDIMVLDDHINLMPQPVLPANCRTVLGRTAGGRIVRTGASPYDPQLLEQVLRTAQRHHFVAHRGVYVAVTGPNYETRAEYRFLRRIGGDVVGMSTVPEVLVAQALGMRVLGLSIVTNVASPDAPQVVESTEVVHAAARAEPHVRQIVADILAHGQ